MSGLGENMSEFTAFLSRWSGWERKGEQDRELLHYLNIRTILGQVLEIILS